MRLTAFFKPEKTSTGADILDSISVRSGKGELKGRGLFHGTQTQQRPRQHTDFIFSAIGEKVGFSGCIARLTGGVLDNLFPA
jgi:rod shape determining protein RodA